MCYPLRCVRLDSKFADTDRSQRSGEWLVSTFFTYQNAANSDEPKDSTDFAGAPPVIFVVEHVEKPQELKNIRIFKATKPFGVARKSI
nr:hypothetical protein [uncultured Desulfobulbus sp.]